MRPAACTCGTREQHGGTSDPASPRPCLPLFQAGPPPAGCSGAGLSLVGTRQPPRDRGRRRLRPPFQRTGPGAEHWRPDAFAAACSDGSEKDWNVKASHSAESQSSLASDQVRGQCSRPAWSNRAGLRRLLVFGITSNALVRSSQRHEWVGTAAPQWLRAGARTAGPGCRYHRRPGAIGVTAPIFRCVLSHAHESRSATGTE